MSVRTSLERWEKDVSGIERKLGGELSKISKPRSLFGKHIYEIEQPLLKAAGIEIQRAVSLIDDTLAVGQPTGLYTDRERGKFARSLLERTHTVLDKWIGV